MTWCPCSKSVAQYVLWFMNLNWDKQEKLLHKKISYLNLFSKGIYRCIHLVSIKFIWFFISYCKHDLHDQLQSKADRITYIKWYDLAENWIHTFISYLYNSWRRFRLFTHLTPVLCCIYCCDNRAVGISENLKGIFCESEWPPKDFIPMPHNFSDNTFRRLILSENLGWKLKARR